MLISSCDVVCWMVTGCVGKLKVPAVKQKIVRSIRAESWKIFLSQSQKGTSGLSFFALEKKSSSGF